MISFLRIRPRVSLRKCAGLALCAVLLASACNKKPARTTPEVLVPSIEKQPSPVPPLPPAAAEAPTPGNLPEMAPPEEAQKHRSKPHKRSMHKPAAPPEPKPETPKIEAEKPEAPKTEAGTEEAPKADSSVQITAAVPRAAVQSQTERTKEMLSTSRAKLAGLNRTLSESEQAMAQQARNYIAQSAQAMGAGDVERAYNLAVKASLLADELAK